MDCFPNLIINYTLIAGPLRMLRAPSAHSHLLRRPAPLSASVNVGIDGSPRCKGQGPVERKRKNRCELGSFCCIRTCCYLGLLMLRP
jgi:hypothetical protein